MIRARATPLLALMCVVLGCATAGGRFDPTKAPRTSGLPTASHYRTSPPAGQALLGDDRAALEDGVARATKATGYAPRRDPRLGALARWALAFFDAHGRFPRAEALDFETHRMGMVEAVPSLGLLEAARGDVAAHVAEQLTEMLAKSVYTHLGAASTREGDRVRVVVALSMRPLELAPVAIQPGRTLHLEGTLNRGYRAPELIVVNPDGRSARQALGKYRRFATDVVLDRAGTYRVELLARGPHGVTVLGNFPVHRGVPVPPPPNPRPMRHGKAGTPTAMRAAMLDLINETRQEADLAPVAIHDGLSKVAMRHNLDMLEHGFIGHVSKTTGRPEDRVEASGLQTPLVAENVGRNYSLEGVHEGLMASPGHRDNILRPEATHVGIDVRATPSDGRHEFLVTQIFVRLIPKLGNDAASRVLDAINQRRRQAGHEALTRDATMERLAIRAAKAYFSPATETQEQQMEQLARMRRAARLPYAAVVQAMAVVSDVAQISAIAEVLDPKARAIGIGLAQGSRPGTTPNAVSVVLLIGH